MKLLHTPKEIKQTFLDNLDWCRSFSGAVAWASRIDDVFDEICRNRKKINQLIVGLHFYQTHPEFIDEFRRSKNVKFVMQTNGTFHPKMFLFKRQNEWRLIVGSANLTQAAFSTNAEICLSVSNEDGNESSTINEAQEVLKKYSQMAEVFSQKDFKNYENVWKNQQKHLKRAAGEYGDLPQNRNRRNIGPIFKCSCLSLSWDGYCDRILNECHAGEHCFEPRKNLLNTIHSIFRSYRKFSMMPLNDRKLIAGVKVDYYDGEGKQLNQGFFGSMDGAGKFMHYINEEYKKLSSALDHIPLEGDINKNAFDKYVNELKNLERVSLGTATRLLAMKRPDIFVCVNRGNSNKLCDGFGISNIYSSNIKKPEKFEQYWNQIICPIQDSVWWNAEKPDEDDNDKLFVWKNRAAFLDSLFYE